MLSFDFFMPVRLIFGTGRLDELEHTPHLPLGDRAMVVMGSGGAMLQEGYLGRLQGLLASRGVATLVCDQTQAHPESDPIVRAAALAREKEAAFIIGLGGGSAIDAAKAIALLARNADCSWEALSGGPDGGRSPVHSALPVVAIPTTAGTGTQVNSWSVVTRSGRAEKCVWGDSSMFPHLAVIDPDLSHTVPAATTAHTGMTAFFQAADALLSANRQPASDLLALEALQIIGRFLPRAAADGTDREARTLLMWASTAAGMCGVLSSGSPMQMLAHTLVALAPGLPHGAALTLLAKSYFTWQGKRHPERFRLMAAALGSPAETPAAEGPATFDAALQTLIKAVGLDHESLSHWGVGDERIADLPRAAIIPKAGLGEAFSAALTPADAESILAECLRGGSG